MLKVVRSKIDYDCTVYGGATQKWLNKITVAYNKGIRICLRSLETTTISALKVESGSVPLQFRRKYLAKKEVLKSSEYDLTIMERLNEIKNKLDGYGLTFLEMNYLMMLTSHRVKLSH